MRRTLVAMVLAIVVAAGSAAQAQGSTVNRLQGTFKNDPNSSISLGVKLDGEGTPVRVLPTRYENVDLVCKDGTTMEISGTAPGGKIKNYTDDGRPMLLVGEAGSPLTHFQGLLNRDGTKATGELYAYTATFADGVTCMTGGGPDASPPDTRAPFTADLASRTGSAHGGTTEPRTHHLTGRLLNDPDSSISFDVIVSDGAPVGVSDVTYSNLDMNCSDGSVQQLSGVVQHNKNLIPTRKGLAFNAGTPNRTQPVIHFTGYLSKSGKQAKGTFFAFTENLACTTGDGLGPRRDSFRWSAN